MDYRAGWPQNEPTEGPVLAFSVSEVIKASDFQRNVSPLHIPWEGYYKSEEAKLDMIRAGKEVEKLEPSCTAGRSVDWWQHCVQGGESSDRWTQSLGPSALCGHGSSHFKKIPIKR